MAIVVATERGLLSFAKEQLRGPAMDDRFQKRYMAFLCPASIEWLRNKKRTRLKEGHQFN